jgi:hypothetical protein
MAVVVGRNARILYGTPTPVAIAYGKNITVKMSAEAIKEYSVDSASPAILASGNQTYTWSIDRLYVDETYANLLLSGTTFQIIFSPIGTPLGSHYVTLTGCIITSSEHSAGESGGVLEKLSGEALTCVAT